MSYEATDAMIPESYKVAYEALEAIWKENSSDSLASILSGMQVNESDGVSMDPGALYDWNQIQQQTKQATELDLILAFLELEASRYKNVPDDLHDVINALRANASRERAIADSIIALWNTSKH
jgi:hypothetical protein